MKNRFFTIFSLILFFSCLSFALADSYDTNFYYDLNGDAVENAKQFIQETQGEKGAEVFV